MSELQHRARGGGKPGGGLPQIPRGIMGGSGLIVALVVGGIVLNSALFNGISFQLDALLHS